MEAEAKKRRKSRPKVKSGCLTCKVRRVKCDETRPECLRCQKFCGNCGGYAETRIIPYSRSGLKVRLLPGRRAILCQPSTTWIQTQEEHRFFKFFIDSMVPQLAGYFESELWNRLILQACQQDVAIQHAVIAIAASKSAVDGMRSKVQLKSESEARTQHQYALNRYSKAIRSMRDATGHRKQDLRMALITSLVIFCFETLHGNHDMAAKQVFIGLDLIEMESLNDKRSKEHDADFYHSRIPDVEDELVQAFGRLDFQTMTSSDRRPASQHLSLKNFGSTTVLEMPTEFWSLGQARGYLHIVVQRLSHLMASITPNYMEGDLHSLKPLRFDVLTYVPNEYIEERKKHLDELELWRAAFSHILDKTLESDKDYLGAKALELLHLTTYLIAALFRTSEERWPDTRRFMPVFTKMVSTAKAILMRSSPDPGTIIIAFDMQVICPLFLVAWRCPHRALRQEAIDLLLSSNRREGLWDSMMAAQYGLLLTKVEEENCWDVEGEYIPDDLRVCGIDVISFDHESRISKVRCLVPPRNGSGWRWRDAVVTW